MNNRVPEVFLSEMFGELRIMFDDLPLYIAGEWVKDKFERYHNFYAVFEQDAAL